MENFIFGAMKYQATKELLCKFIQRIKQEFKEHPKEKITYIKGKQ